MATFKPLPLKGRKAFITGASRGIGRAIALRLARDGAEIAFNYRSNEEAANSLKQEIQSMNVRAIAFKTDISNFKEVQRMKDAALELFGTIDILINNAGIIKDGALAMLPEEDWDRVIDTNLKGTYNASKAFIVSFMKQQKGDIINITSLSGIVGIARQTNYAASKGGIISFTKALAKEVAGFQVKVNAVAPGFIQTDMLDGLSQIYLNKAKDLIPLKRFGTPDDVSGVVSFLLSEAARYITGQVIRVDGGMGM